MYTKEELELHRRFGGGATLDGLQCESRSRSLVEHTHIPMVQLSRVIVSHVAPSADHRDRGKMPRKAAYLDSHSIFFRRLHTNNRHTTRSMHINNTAGL